MDIDMDIDDDEKEDVVCSKNKEELKVEQLLIDGCSKLGREEVQFVGNNSSSNKPELLVGAWL
jgi:hypothetical protein